MVRIEVIPFFKDPVDKTFALSSSSMQLVMVVSMAVFQTLAVWAKHMVSNPG